MFWNEPNNKSHWDSQLDPEWRQFGEMVKLAARAVAAENDRVTRVLGGHVADRPSWVRRMEEYGVLALMDAVAVHGFPLDWNNWMIDEWPARLREIQDVTELPVGCRKSGSRHSARGGAGVRTEATAELLIGRAPRIHWYSLYDLPAAWPATTRHREAEGSSYYRHFHMGLLREDGTPKRALQLFQNYTPEMGICQWFHFEDPRLDDAVRVAAPPRREAPAHRLSWADSFRSGADAWFDRQMSALEGFDVTITYCFTPEHRGPGAHHTSPPYVPEEFAEFCARMTRRYVNAPLAAAL
jgi:beta-xylosidase